MLDPAPEGAPDRWRRSGARRGYRDSDRRPDPSRPARIIPQSGRRTARGQNGLQTIRDLALEYRALGSRRPGALAPIPEGLLGCSREARP